MKSPFESRKQFIGFVRFIAIDFFQDIFSDSIFQNCEVIFIIIMEEPSRIFMGTLLSAREFTLNHNG